MSSAFHVDFADARQDDLESVLRALRDALARHPIAAQAAFSALAREGRAYAQTAEGAALRDALSRSQLFARLRLTWETLTMAGFTEHPAEIVPSVYLEGMLRAVTDEALETLLSRVFDPKE